MQRDSFVFYRSFFDALKLVSDPESRAELALAIIEYGLNGEICEQFGETTQIVMALIKPQIDSNNKKYQNGCKGAEHGKKGGRPPKSKTPQKPLENPTETPNVNVDDNVDVNDNDKKEYPPSSDKEKPAPVGASVDVEDILNDENCPPDPLVSKTLDEVIGKSGQIAREQGVEREEVVGCAREVAALWALTGEFDRKRPVTHMLRTVVRKLQDRPSAEERRSRKIREAEVARIEAEVAAEKAECDAAMSVDSAAALRAYKAAKGLRPEDSVTATLPYAKNSQSVQK